MFGGLFFYFQLLLLTIIFSFIYIFVIRLYLKMRSLQESLKLKNIKSRMIFRPIIGIQSLMKGSVRKYNDSQAVFYKMLQEDPDLKVLVVNFLTTPTIILLDPDMIKEVLTVHYDRYDKFFKPPITMKYLGGKSLVQARGERWKVQRKCMAASFSFEKLETSLPLIQGVIDEKFADLEGRISDNKPLKLLEEMGFIAAEVVIRFFMGEVFTNRTINGNKCDREIEWIVSNVTREDMKPLSLMKLFLFPKAYRSLTPWALSAVQKKVVKRAEIFNEEIRQVINKKKEDILKNVQPAKEEKFENLLTVLIKQHIAKPEEVPFDEIISHFILLYFAGMDTTSHWLSLSVYALAKYPEYQKKLREEVNQVCGKNTEISYKMLNELNFLRAFMNEVLRLYTPAPSILPRVCLEDHMLQGFKITKGTGLIANLICSMRNQKYFPDPENFYPERWLSNDSAKINSFAFIPFSGGPRNCIGQHLSTLEAKLVMINLLRTFEVTLNPKRELILEVVLLRTPKFDDLVFFKKL